jgi:tRNA (guanine37-N1)-methyltransferase
MRFDVLTLFPELFEPFLATGVTRRAYASRQVDVRLWQLRDHADDNYRRVDDRTYGGGPGMVMLVEPLERALAAVRQSCHAAESAEPAAPDERPVILFSPAGAPLTQARVERLAASSGAVLVCGRYEGLDQRFINRHVSEEISLGDFVLSGGELPALVLLDAVTRLQPGVLNAAASHQQDSFSDGLLDCPHYSRPERLGDAPEDAVPEVLLSGHHAHIARWRRDQQLQITARRRPDLIAAARAAGRLSAADEKTLRQLGL